MIYTLWSVLGIVALVAIVVTLVSVFRNPRISGGEKAVLVIATIPYLGGAAAVGASVAVLTVFAPSGLGVREASMYGLLLAVASEAVALGATVLNRLAITLVEAVLLLVGALMIRRRRPAVDGAPEIGPELVSVRDSSS